MDCERRGMMKTAAIIIHFAVASMFGLFGFSWIANSGYGFVAGLIGFIAGVGAYCAVLVVLSMLVLEFIEWLDRIDQR